MVSVLFFETNTPSRQRQSRTLTISNIWREFIRKGVFLFLKRPLEKNCMKTLTKNSERTLYQIQLSFRHHLERRFVFAWRFILNKTILFWVLSETIKFVFSVSVLFFSTIYPKTKFTALNCSDLCNFYSKGIFFFFFFFVFSVSAFCSQIFTLELNL